MKHVIEIDCDGYTCGKCTYWKETPRNRYGLYVRDYHCMLFDMPIGTEERVRCSDCVRTIRNFNKMPQLEES